MNKKTTLDLTSLAKDILNNNGGDYKWPTDYREYSFLSDELIEIILSVVSSYNSDCNEAIAIKCKLGEIVPKISHAIRLSIDITNSSQPIDYTTAESPILHGLLQNENMGFHTQNKPYQPIKTKCINVLRKTKRQLQSRIIDNTSRFDIIHPNSLLLEYVKQENKPTVEIIPEFWAWPKRREKIDNSVIDALFDATVTCITKHVPQLKSHTQRLRQYIKEVLQTHLNEAITDLKWLKASKVHKRSANTLLCGTPKYKGSLISWYYKSHGKKVLRFTHGGERGLYTNRIWPLKELLYCDEYYMHGKKEKELTESNAGYEGIKKTAHITTTFKTKGSQKHHKIFKSCNAIKDVPEGNTIMYVPGSYLGDLNADFPTFRPPDALILEWQNWLLNELKTRNQNILIKIHPKGLKFVHNQLLARYGKIVTDSPFDPARYSQVKKFFFDFAGTAFIDSLASNKEVVFFDWGVREWNKGARESLKKRASIYDCSFDENGRLRTTTKNIDKSVAKNTEDQAERAKEFLKSYFTK